MSAEQPFTPEYTNYLAEHFDPALVAQLSQEQRLVDLTHQKGEQVP